MLNKLTIEQQYELAWFKLLFAIKTFHEGGIKDGINLATSADLTIPQLVLTETRLCKVFKSYYSLDGLLEVLNQLRSYNQKSKFKNIKAPSSYIDKEYLITTELFKLLKPNETQLLSVEENNIYNLTKHNKYYPTLRCFIQRKDLIRPYNELNEMFKQIPISTLNSIISIPFIKKTLVTNKNKNYDIAADNNSDIHLVMINDGINYIFTMLTNIYKNEIEYTHQNDSLLNQIITTLELITFPSATIHGMKIQQEQDITTSDNEFIRRIINIKNYIDDLHNNSNKSEFLTQTKSLVPFINKIVEIDFDYCRKNDIHVYQHSDIKTYYEKYPKGLYTTQNGRELKKVVNKILEKYWNISKN